MVDLVLRVAKRRYLPVFRWAVTEGVRRLDGEHPAQRMYGSPQPSTCKRCHEQGLSGFFLEKLDMRLSRTSESAISRPCARRLPVRRKAGAHR